MSERNFVRKRRVYFIAGFDPRGARHYHALYRRQSARQSELNGLKITVGHRIPQAKDSVVTWDIECEDEDGKKTETVYEFLAWDDIVRRYWPKGDKQILAEGFRFYSHLLKTNLIGKAFRLSWAPAFVGAYPALILICFCLLGVLAGTALGLAATLLFHLPVWTGWLIGLASFAGVLYLGRSSSLANRCFWAIRTYGFVRRWGNGGAPELDARLKKWARRITRQANGADEDEILIASHSVGTVLLPVLIKEALSINPNLTKQCPQISLLTLGSLIPMAGFVPKWKDYREALRIVAVAPDLEWLDFSAPSDGTFALNDPIGACGIERPAGSPIRPKLLSPRFVRMYSPERYAEIRRNYLHLHLQYLMAGELPTHYDYFAITAGPLTLAGRYAALESPGRYFLTPSCSQRKASGLSDDTFPG